MKVTEFDYILPDDLIAQTPVTPRDASRLMVVPREGGPIQHKSFRDIVEFVRPGDILVVNDSRVLPARLYGQRDDRQPSEGSVEVLLLREVGADTWECLVRPGRKFKPGTHFSFGQEILRAEVLEVTAGGERILKFQSPQSVKDAIHQVGTMPLPPYIKERLEDQERYQTVYSREEGSSAAPTAGLHFTEDLLGRILMAGAAIVPITLHVGLGTFRPVKADDISEHQMHAEYYHITPDAAEIINAATGRIWCVGTTSVRALESGSTGDGEIKGGGGWTDIFIYPGYGFKVADALVTNFHLPKSTLLMLVSAFAGKENTLDAYRAAVREGYRFFSFGDAMLLI